MEEQTTPKKKHRTIGIFTILSLLVTLTAAGFKIHDFYANRELRHFFGESAAYITDLSADEQAQLLAAYDVKIPASEKNAYISAFGKSEQNGKYSVCFIEFDGVDDYRAFYNANTHRAPSINQTTNSDDAMYLVYGERVLPKDENAKRFSDLFAQLSEQRK